MDFSVSRVSIDHDHVYSSKTFDGRSTENLETKEESRRRMNKISSRLCRLSRRTKCELNVKKSREYEDLNVKLKEKVTVLNEVIRLLKDQLRTYFDQQSAGRSIGLVRRIDV